MPSPSGIRRWIRRIGGTLFCAAALLSAACHNNNLDSGYGNVWVTLTDDPGDFATYIVNVDSITLLRNDGAVVTALDTPETVDFTKLSNYAELWGTADVPTGTYTQATIVLDYTSVAAGGTSAIAVMVGGKPVQASVIDSTGAAPTTITVNLILDPAKQGALTIVPTYATTAGVRLALDLNLAASTVAVDLAAAIPVVMVKPYMTAAIAPPDNKLIRVRGPLINSSVDLQTYTVYERPFYDEEDTLGTLTIFTNANTVFSTNGIVTTGTAGLTQLSQSSAGTTVTAAFTTYQPTLTPSATAAIFTAKYVVAGSTLEDYYTQGLEGDVIARVGNTVTLQNSTLFLNDGLSYYCTNYAFSLTATSTLASVVLGPSTLVTADGNATLTGLNYNSVAVGQHIIVRGEYSLVSGVVTLNALSTTTNTGSVRLISTYLWGNFIAASTSGLTLNLATIDGWPVSAYTFTGNGSSTAADPVAANFVVNTGALVQPAFAANDPVYLSGLFTPFASAPPDFTASAVNSQLSVQSVGAAAGSVTCGQGLPNLDCIPASMRVSWSGASTAAVFSTLTATGMTVNAQGTTFVSGVIRIGSQVIDLATLPTAPLIVPQVGVSGGTGLPAIYLPLFSYGDPLAISPLGISQFSDFATFTAGLTTALATTAPLQFEARGTYNPATNTFSASSVSVVL